jgi:hypothetical protein
MPAMANLPALPRTAAALPPHAEREMARRRREGEDPTIAPKVVLETPMWLDPRVAARRSRLTREFRDLWHGAPIVNSLDVANPLPPEGEGSRSQHGLLRYLDLDVIMALSKAWVESGGGEGSVEVEQIRIFEWMGYQNLLTAPYSELRASLQRLKWTSIAVGEAGGRPVPFKLIEGFSEEKEDGRGSPKLLKARLDPIWCNALRTVHDWQAVDLQAYAKLAREHRRMGLARVIYLYLVSHRNASDEFHVPLYSLRDRYAQRRFLPGPEGDDGQVAGRSVLRRSDPMDDEELLKRALKTLHETGVCELAPVSAARLSDASLRGRFVRPREPMVLVTQQRFISPGLWDGTPRVVGAPALPAPAAPAAQEPPSPPPAPPAPEPPRERTPEHESTIMLNRELRVGKSAFRKAVGESGWSVTQILHLMAEVYWLHKAEGQVERPAGLFVAKLRDSAPSHYDDPPQPAWGWLRQAWPTLPVFKKPKPAGTGEKRP